MIDAIGRIIGGDAPVFLLIAGPNGSSKSTFTEKRLKHIPFPCIDPDAIGRELFGRHPATKEEAIQATQEATQRVREHFRERRSVGLETVFSDTKGHKLGLLEEARAAGFRTVIIFIGVDSPEICIARVMDRVEHGGHDVPDHIITDRFPRCFDNLKTALKVVDLAILIDNSGCYGPKGSPIDGRRHYIFGVIEHGRLVELHNPVPYWFLEFKIGEAIRAAGD
jgi:predicted ABC-type ATPase